MKSDRGQICVTIRDAPALCTLHYEEDLLEWAVRNVHRAEEILIRCQDFSPTLILIPRADGSVLLCFAGLWYLFGDLD
jgi:hypothetical protein